MLVSRFGSDTGIVRQNLQSVAETRETVLFQPVGAQELSIAVSSFQRLASPVPPTFSKNSKKEPITEVN